MLPTNFDESNVVLDKPENMSRDECDALCMYRGVDTNGNLLHISCWKPTQEELDEINKTGRIWLYLFGAQVQPHHISGTNPFK